MSAAAVAVVVTSGERSILGGTYSMSVWAIVPLLSGGGLMSRGANVLH